MGLHLCYELALPRETAATAVTERVGLLHDVATRLPFAKVSPLIQVSAGETLGDVNLFDCTLDDFFRLSARIRLDAVAENPGTRVDHLPDAAGFAVHPGRYCEAAIFAHPRFEELESEPGT